MITFIKQLKVIQNVLVKCVGALRGEKSESSSVISSTL